MSSFTNALGLDVGDVRIGVARINSIAQITEPLMVIKNDELFTRKLRDLVAEYSIDLIVVGLPRNMKGEKTKQTAVIEEFVEKTLGHIGVAVEFQDETLSTVAAEARMPKNSSHLQDAYAACIILEDFMQTTA